MPCHTMAQHVRLQSGRKNVNSRLDRVRDWRDLAREAKYQVRGLAKICGVSERQLRRYVFEHLKKRSKRWLDELRAEAAKRDFERGDLVKAASNDVQFNHASNFTRFAKRVLGETPQNLMQQSSMSGIDKECPQKVTDVRNR